MRPRRVAAEGVAVEARIGCVALEHSERGVEAVVAAERFVPGALTFLKLPTYHARPAARCFSARGSSPRTHWARILRERFRFFANECFAGLLEVARATVARSRLCRGSTETTGKTWATDKT